MRKLFNRLNRRVGIDLGSARTRIWIQNHGLVVDEPSLIAVNQKNNKVMAVGQPAQAMQGRVGEQTKVFEPIQYPKIIDDALLRAMLKVFFRQASQETYFFSPTMLVALPSNTYPVMREVVVDVLTELGASEVLIVDQTLAAAIGAGVPTADASGTFILQMGASVVEATSLSMSKIVKTCASNQAGNDMCYELVYWFKDHKQLKISFEIAQNVQQQLGNFAIKEDSQLEVSGLDTKSGSLRELTIGVQEIEEIIVGYGNHYVGLVKKMLADIPPSLVVDIVDKGLLLSGGLAQISGLESFLTDKLDVPVCLVDDPETSVIRGVGTILDHLDEFRESI
jgi:rod shape-determining protein MreB